jgi:ubiquinol-cytochrome c reductase cytochrome b subunit
MMLLSFKKQPIVQIVNDHLIDYPTPSNISLFWNYGFLAGMCLGIQIITGILLAMHYTPHVDLAFLSVEHIMRDVNGGWLLRYTHANGASMFFIVVFIHIGRGLYYGSYAQPRGLVWTLGVIILILMMATAFLGYVLVWGQMSFWAATVITNFFTAFPYIGNKIVTLLWGGFSVDNATLNRFFSLHYLVPFLIAAFAIVHMAVVHQDGSNNPLGISSHSDKISFFPYFFIKDTLGLVAFLIFFSFFVYYSPNFLGHSDNYIPGNPMVTPAHIVPEWYFLPAYAILRSIPNKLIGVIALFASLLVLLALPLVNTSEVRSSLYRPLHKVFFWLLVADYLVLGYLGQQVPESPFIEIGQIASIYYFAYFLVIIPVLGRLEKSIRLSI